MEPRASLSCLDVDRLVNFGGFAEDVNPLAEVRELPHVADAMKQLRSGLFGVAIDSLNGPFAGRHGELERD